MLIIAKFIIQAIAVFVTAYLLRDGIVINGFTTALIVAFVLGVINTLIKPILFLFTLPINIMTLGLFTFFLNGLMIFFTSLVVSGFYVKNIWWAILFSLVLSVVNWFIHLFTK